MEKENASSDWGRSANSAVPPQFGFSPLCSFVSFVVKNRSLRLTCSSACALTGAPVTFYLPRLSSSDHPGDFGAACSAETSTVPLLRCQAAGAYSSWSW